MDFTHVKTLKENNIDPNTLPNEIKNHLRRFSLLGGQYKKNPDDEKKAQAVTDADEKINKMIEQHIIDEAEKAAKEEEKAAKEEEEAKKKAEEEAERKKKIAHLPFVDKQEEVEAELDQNNGQISMAKLTSIIGIKPNYPDQVVGTITLGKVFMKSAYKKK